MTIVEMIGVALIGKLITDLMGDKKKNGEPPKPQPPAPTSPGDLGPPRPPVKAPGPITATKPKPEPKKPPPEPKPALPAKPADIKWPADFSPPAIVDPATGRNDPATATVPASRQPNKGKPEPVYVPPQPTKSPDIHKPGGYTPPQPQVKQTKGQAVSQTEEAAVIARERNPTSAYWMPRKSPSAAEVKAAVEMLQHWRNGALVFAGPRSFAGRRMFKHTKHGTKKAVEVWQPRPPFV